MKTFKVSTGQTTAFVDITGRVAAALAELKIAEGAVLVFVPHTTAGVTINENADPDVVRDLEAALERAVPRQGAYRHGEGNSAAHVKASLMGSSALIPVVAGRLQLGTWQAVYLCEFDGPRTRMVWVQGLAGVPAKSAM